MLRRSNFTTNPGKLAMQEEPHKGTWAPTGNGASTALYCAVTPHNIKDQRLVRLRGLITRLIRVRSRSKLRSFGQLPTCSCTLVLVYAGTCYTTDCRFSSFHGASQCSLLTDCLVKPMLCTPHMREMTGRIVLPRNLYPLILHVLKRGCSTIASMV